MITTNKEERRLPETILNKAIRSGNEFGWRQTDFIETIEAARKLKMGIVGGQVQYVFPDGTCELYWLSYDPSERQVGEDWIKYCNRTSDETIKKFKDLITKTDFDKETFTFDFLRDKKLKGVSIEDNKVFIIYFNDTETDLWTGE
ncbi:MAG: hypothetical protein J7604_24950 [Sporocytophaga sp.]|uniref:hypothetical protein n=1 Tax=Sporocytophaga sp. TaxID=2231183 RepID=UPI001B253C5B|nr:hypothetical protein [Sporocytophaga sp.]MBO9703480.1 hypothetical protein [Sporocytophaga sp.]